MADYLIEVAGGALWQWDTGRKIKIQTWENRSVTEAHFSIVGSDQALVLDVYEENGEMFSNIPNILLQQEEKIRIYLVDNNRTVGDHTESIIPRTKPDDYVYTETEIKNYEALEKKIPTKMSQLENDIELGSKAFIINVTGSGTEDDPYTSDKTFEEIKQAYDDGRELECILDGNIKDEVSSEIYYESVPFFCTGLYEYGFVFVSYYEINSGISASILIDVNTQVMARSSTIFLSTANSFTYTPTEDYHPATKKYVDDAVKGRRELVFECAPNAKMYTGTMQESIVDCFENPDMDFEVEVTFYNSSSINYKFVVNKYSFEYSLYSSGKDIINYSHIAGGNASNTIALGFSRNGKNTDSSFDEGYHEFMLYAKNHTVTSVKVYKITK